MYYKITELDFYKGGLMPGSGEVSGADKRAKRSRALAIRCAKLRREGFTLTEISEITGVTRDSVTKRIQLGERLLTLNT